MRFCLTWLWLLSEWLLLELMFCVFCLSGLSPCIKAPIMANMRKTRIQNSRLSMVIIAFPPSFLHFLSCFILISGCVHDKAIVLLYEESLISSSDLPWSITFLRSFLHLIISILWDILVFFPNSQSGLNVKSFVMAFYGV